MGLNNRQTNKTYLNIFKDKFTLAVKEGTPEAITRKNKEEKIVHELHFNSLEHVIITKIEKKISDNYGASWEIVLREVDEEFILRLPYSGRVTGGLLFRLPNMDFSKPVSLRLFMNKEEKVYLTVYDGLTDEKIEAAYSKDAPNGLPPLTQELRKGKMEWVDDAQMAFIEEMIERTIQPKLLAQLLTPAPDAPTDPIVDDLPF
jgi:hypothetical protein